MSRPCERLPLKSPTRNTFTRLEESHAGSRETLGQDLFGVTLEQFGHQSMEKVSSYHGIPAPKKVMTLPHLPQTSQILTTGGLSQHGVLRVLRHQLPPAPNPPTGLFPSRSEREPLPLARLLETLGLSLGCAAPMALRFSRWFPAKIRLPLIGCLTNKEYQLRKKKTQMISAQKQGRVLVRTSQNKHAHSLETFSESMQS